jgi:hypothetical protein
MVLKYLTGQYYSQSSLAGNLGITPGSGTYVYKIPQVINQYSSAFYSYRNTSDLHIEHAIRESVNRNHPLIVNVDLNRLYSSQPSSGHYIVITGYNFAYPGTPQNQPVSIDGFYPKSVTYIDPYRPVSGRHTVSLDRMNDACNARGGYYIYG